MMASGLETNFRLSGRSANIYAIEEHIQGCIDAQNRFFVVLLRGLLIFGSFFLRIRVRFI